MDKEISCGERMDCQSDSGEIGKNKFAETSALFFVSELSEKMVDSWDG